MAVIRDIKPEGGLFNILHYIFYIINHDLYSILVWHYR